MSVGERVQAGPYLANPQGVFPVNFGAPAAIVPLANFNAMIAAEFRHGD